jgi:hypothetical protein
VYLQSGSNWFNSTLTIAQSFDTNNRNSLKNNIPVHLIDSGDNEQYLLFLDMIGHHFDVIWSYINGMSDTKNITETNNYGIHDDFLYDYLKSFGWDARNLNSNKQLWSYLFGKDSDGNVVEESTSEERTKIIWRRIANNLPYLLKNKGTKRGISALLNCYGIAGSNLSIVEFGGPDTDDAFEPTKYIYDTQTANLNFTSGSYLTTRWSGSKGIELRIKPAYSGSGVTLVKGNSFTLSFVILPVFTPLIKDLTEFSFSAKANCLTFVADHAFGFDKLLLFSFLGTEITVTPFFSRSEPTA